MIGNILSHYRFVEEFHRELPFGYIFLRGDRMYTYKFIGSGTDTVIEWWQNFASTLDE